MQNYKTRQFKPLNAMLLSMFGLISKGTSVLFKIVLIAIIGTVGIGYYQLTFPLFVFLFSISSVGIATTFTMQVAETGWNNTFRSGGFSYARKSTFIVSIISSLLLVLLSPFIAKVQGSHEITYIYYSVGVAIVCVSVLTFYRGVLRGNELVKAYAISDIVEQFSKLILSVLLALLLIQFGEVYAVIGVFLGVSMSALVTLVYIKFALSKVNHLSEDKNECKLFNKSQFLKFSFIAGLSSILLPFVQFIDSIVVVRMLNRIGHSVTEATALFGLSRGNISALINLPNTIIVALEFLLLPDILKTKVRKKVSRKCGSTLTIAFALGVFMGSIFFAFSEEILGLIYHGTLTETEKVIAQNLLKIGSLTVIFSSLSQIQSVVLQGIKKLHLPIISLSVASIIKIVFELIFIGSLGIYAAELSNVLFYISLALTNGIFLIKNNVKFGNPINLVVLIGIIVWVTITKLVYNFIVIKVNFIVAVSLALLMTAIISVALTAPIFIKLRKKDIIKKAM